MILKNQKLYVNFDLLINILRIFSLKKDFFFGYVEDFNDPFEFSSNLSIAGLTIDNKKVYHTCKNSLVVSCLTEEDTKNNILLWSHYADLHRGICIQFTPNYEYEKSPFYGLKQVIYHKDIPTPKSLREDKIEEYIYSILISKAKCWSYEKEWRVIDINTEGHKVKETQTNGLIIDRGRQFNFEPNELTKVIISCKVGKNDERVVLNWINELGNPDIIVEKSILDKDKYKLIFAQINIKLNPDI